MRLLIGLILVCLTVSYSQTQFTGVQLNSLQSLLSYSSQIQALVNQLNTVLPQLSGILSSSQLQSLNDQIVRLVTSQLGNKPTIDDLKQLIRPLLEQFVGTTGQGRIDFDTVLQQITNTVVTALPSILFGLLGKREVAQVDDRSLDQVLSMINQLPISSVLTYVQTYLGSVKYQQLQNQLVSIAVTAAASNWNPTTISQAIQQLFTQFVPQLGMMRLDWDAVGQAALSGLVSVLPTILVGLIGKREVAQVDDRSLDQVLSMINQLPISSVLTYVQTYLGSVKYQQLQNQLVSIAVTAAASNWNPTTISQAIQQLFTQFVPELGMMRIDWDAVGQAALNGVVSVLPTILVGLLGKRDINFDIKELLAQLPLQQLAQLLQVAISGQNAAVFTQVRNLLQSFLPSYSVRVNFDELAANFLNQLNTLFPNINQSILTAILG